MTYCCSNLHYNCIHLHFIQTSLTHLFGLEAHLGSFNSFRFFFLYSSARSLKEFDFIQNVTFETRSMKTATIKKSFSQLLVLARTSTTASGTIAFYIYSIKIRYYFCGNTTMYNTDVTQVYSSTTNISKLVKCPDNALASDGKSTNIPVQCTPKGNWTFGDLNCICDKGFFSSNQSCTRK